jgi:hypothetical protein
MKFLKMIDVNVRLKGGVFVTGERDACGRSKIFIDLGITNIQDLRGQYAEGVEYTHHYVRVWFRVSHV